MEAALDVGDFHQLLTSPAIRTLLGHTDDNGLISLQSREDDWEDFISCRVNQMLEEFPQPNLQQDIFLAGCAALHAFLQSNVTGPPLSWKPSTTIIPEDIRANLDPRTDLQRELLRSLSVDGESVYVLTPNIELFCLAKCLLNHPAIIGEEDVANLRFRLRVNTWHQRLLSEIAPSVQQNIYSDLETLNQKLPLTDHQSRADFLVERASIHILHGFDVQARTDLSNAAKERKFKHVLTGRLGKRTKFQQNDLSQLVVLAKSADENTPSEYDGAKSADGNSANNWEAKKVESAQPTALELNDDTLLESISFSSTETPSPADAEEARLSEGLQDLDPANQPVLDPLDSIILLAIASSITNTSPQDGLTREETVPYATRVLSNPSTNWQIYTQALLVRSRIEGYRSRTVERGLLQLQAIVDQVIAETTPSDATAGTQAVENDVSQTTTFLPQAKPSESAPVQERLRYIHLLASPTRWKLESELADRWVSLGGLKSALDIYERLQMWAEVALCWAAQDREAEARKVIHGQLYTSSQSSEAGDETATHESLKEKIPLPNDAPRLFCILGDLNDSVAPYERAWRVSDQRYARAQRSLGKYYFKRDELQKADEAYAKSLKINPLNHSIWFALGCVRLKLEDWNGAVDAFTRAVQADDQDAESWSNLAAALLQLPQSATSDPQKHTREAFVALKRAANFKRESYRIWQNLLQVAIQLSPPPYPDIIIAQNRIIELLGPKQGEKSIDVPVVEGLVNHLIAISAPYDGTQDSRITQELSGPGKQLSGYERLVVELVQKKITPLITSSRRLWLLNAKLSLHLQRPSAALAAYEKAWRVTTNQPGWDSGAAESKDLWKDVAEATSDLADAYESLGERERESGLGEGEMIAKDWRFKARSAIRGIIGRAKDTWAGTQDLEMLETKLTDLKNA